MPLIPVQVQEVAIAEALTPIPATLAPLDFRATYQASLDTLDTKVQMTAAFLEELQEAIGNGALSGGTISAGAGLSASVAAFKAFVSTVIETDSATTVALTASVTNYLFLRQDNTWTVNSTGAVPTDISTHGAYLFWGTATTNVSAVTATNNERQGFSPRAEYDRINAYQSESVPDGVQKMIFDSLTSYGTASVYGKMRII